jgi:hypothetical protein
MLGTTGQLGIGGLGNFILGTVRVGQVFVPHRGQAHSALSATSIRSALTANRARSTISAPARARSEVTNE